MFVYKILSQSAWEQSLELGFLPPQPLDNNFIHLCEEVQVSNIIAKYWSTYTAVVVAKLDPAKLIGNLVKEKNPGGVTEYYHLYDGQIPIEAVVDFKQQYFYCPLKS